MANPSHIPALERPAFFTNQQLLAEDLDGLFDYQRELRWLHNRALHGWGIAAGLDVFGTQGARTVQISAGYALDCDGHDLVLPDKIELQVPPILGDGAGEPVRWYLTVSYIDDSDLYETESRDGVCEGGGAVLRAETAQVRWQDPAAVNPPEARFRPGRDLILAEVKIVDCQLAAAPDPTLRRSLGRAGPRVAGGATPAGSTTWSLFAIGGATAGVETTVDTMGAGFGATPNYVAQLAGDWHVGGNIVAAGWGRVEEPTASGFRFRVYLPRGMFGGPHSLNTLGVLSSTGLQKLRSGADWHVHWVGTEDGV